MNAGLSEGKTDMEMPTRNGISIPICELELPESALNLERPENFTNHHHEWQRRAMGRFSITQTLRDLDRHQTPLPRDVHNALHNKYEPPRFPTLQQAMEEVDNAYHNGEMMKVYLFDEKRYVYHPISLVHMRTLQMEYNQYGKL